MTQTREWLLLNAVECWLYHYQNRAEHSDQYIILRDELREMYEQSKDVPEPTKLQRKRSSKPTNETQPS